MHRLTKKKSHIEQWFGNDIERVGMQGKDVVLEEGTLFTTLGARNVYLPRPFPVKEKAKAVIENNLTGSKEEVDWEPSDAYVLGHEATIRSQGEPIRAFLVRLRLNERRGG